MAFESNIAGSGERYIQQAGVVIAAPAVNRSADRERAEREFEAQRNPPPKPLTATQRIGQWYEEQYKLERAAEEEAKRKAKELRDAIDTAEGRLRTFKDSEGKPVLMRRSRITEKWEIA